jgi:uncharacterized cupin superfamily protein
MTEDGLFVCKSPGMADNIWSDDWDSLGDNDWEKGMKSFRLPRAGTVLGASVYELPPGRDSAYHFHHAADELLVALTGGVTLRTAEGERVLANGEAVFFPAGPDGLHGTLNRTADAVRYLVAGTRFSPEVVEYPDLGQVTAQSRLASQKGEPLFLIHTLGEEDAP